MKILLLVGDNTRRKKQGSTHHSRYTILKFTQFGTNETDKSKQDLGRCKEGQVVVG